MLEIIWVANFGLENNIMPDLSTLHPDDLKYFHSLGYSDDEIAAAPYANEHSTNDVSKSHTIASNLKAHAGGLIGGGAGTLAGMGSGAALGEMIFPPGGGIPGAAIGGLIGGIGGGGLGGAAGQKIQEELTPADIYAQQQAEAEQSAAANPKTALATDITAGSLAAGFRPSGEVLTAGKGLIGRLVGKELTEEAKNALIGSSINAAAQPAINTGISLATGQGVPSGMDLGAQALGGALFGKQAKWAGKLTGHAPDEPSNDTTTTSDPSIKTTTTAPSLESLWNAKDDDGNYKIGNNYVKQNYLASEGIITPVPKTGDAATIAAIKTKNDAIRRSTDFDAMRAYLHNKEMEKTVLPEAQDDPDYKGGEMPEINNKWDTGTVKVEPKVEPPTDTTGGEMPETKSGMEGQEADTTPTAVGRPETAPELPVSGLNIEQPGLRDRDEVRAEQQRNFDPDELQEKMENTGSVHATPDTLHGGEKINMPIAAIAHIRSGNATTESVITHLANANGHPFQPLAKELLANMDDDSRKVKWSYNKLLDQKNAASRARSNYSSGSDKVNIGTESSTDARIVMEEAIHSMTSKKIPYFGGEGGRYYNNLKGYMESPDANPHVKDLIDCYFKTVKHLGVHDELFAPDKSYISEKNGTSEYVHIDSAGPAGDPDRAVKQLNLSGHTTKYALGDLHEFIAQAMKSPEFQKVLDSIPTKDNRTVMQKIVDAVRGMLGISKKNENMLDRVLRSSGELIKQDRPEKLKEKAQGEYLDSYDKNIPHLSKEQLMAYDKAEDSSKGDIPVKDKLERFEKSLSYSGLFSGEEFKNLVRHHELFLKAHGEGLFSDSNNQIHSAPPSSPAHATPANTNLPPDTYMSKFGTIIRAVIDKIRDHNDPRFIKTADAFQMAIDKETQLKGRWKNAIVQAGMNLSKGQRDRVAAAFEHDLVTKSKTGMAMLNSNEERQFYIKAHQLLDDSGAYRLAIGEPVVQAVSKGGKTIYIKRNLKQNPWYTPSMANQRVMDVYRSNVDHTAIANLDQVFHDYNTKQLGLTPSESAQRIANFKVAMQGSLKGSDISHQDYFNAHRKAQGTPLPPSFREQDPVRNLERYFDRSAIDASHYEHIEKNHEVMSALGQTQDAWGNKIKPTTGGGIANNQDVKAGLNHWRGEPVSPAEGNESSLSSLITSSFISGPALEAHKLISNVVSTLALAQNPILMARAISHGMTNIMSGYQHAVENGVVHLTARSISQMFSGSATMAEKMQSLARVIRKVSSLDDITTKVGGGLVQAMNEVIIPSKVSRANAGDVTSQLFIKRLDPTYVPGKNYSDSEMQQLASRSANYIHGTGDIRSLPGWMLNDSEFSGFFSLAHWSIAQTNNFMKNVYEPATRGDIKPLLAGVFGAAVGGYLIKELRQDIQGKKNPIPSLQEIQNSDQGLEGNKGLIAYNVIAAMQYAGFGGLLSQIAKYPFDFAYKNNPQGATFPMDEVAMDMGETLHYVSEAIANDPNVNWVDLAQAVSMHTLSTNFQLGRIAINQGINTGLIHGLPAEKKELQDKMAQLRRFDMVNGLPYNDIDQGSNPYMNLEQKKFKSTQDINQAMQMLPGLVSNIIDTYKDRPDVMMGKLKALKENQYSTFPSMEQMPISFMKYVGYLQRTEGPDAAQAEFQDYMKHKIVNEAKASAVP